MEGDFPEVTTVTDPESLARRPERRSGVAYLVMIYGEFQGRRFEIKDTAMLIGRASDCTLQLSDDSVSRNHCRLVPGDEGVMLVDLHSTNGTYVNDTVAQARLLRDGDRIQIGRVIFKFLTGDNIEHAYHEEIYRLKTTDGLTGAFNKRYLMQEIEREIFRFLRYKRPLSLVMMDIDHFKNINDEFGHLAGDRVLAQLGQIVGGSVRREDTFARYGGEEFCILMPELDLGGAIEVGERVRGLVESAHFEFEGIDLRVTVSVGVATALPAMAGPEELVRLADEQLYAAKRGGRNRTEPSPRPR